MNIDSAADARSALTSVQGERRCNQPLRRYWVSFVLCSMVLPTFVAPALQGQYPGAQPMSLPRPLYVRLAGPAGMQVTVYRGGRGVTLPAPAIVGVRPGYTYRLALSGMSRFPGQTFYPSLEVRGSLMVAEKIRASDF